MDNKKTQELHANIHKDHRLRMREKFINALEEGNVDNVFQDHELLEILLYTAIPRRNTNDIAHYLIDEFGSIGGIVDADKEQLEKVYGMGENAAVLVKLVSTLAKRYINDVNDIKNTRLTPLNIGSYIKNLFYGHTNEIAYLLFLDKDCVVRKIKRLASGTVNATPIYPREVVKLAVNERFPYVILAHNHPNSNSMPSAADIEMTKIIEKALSFVEVRLVDHVIVANDKVTSLAKNFKFLRD